MNGLFVYCDDDVYLCKVFYLPFYAIGTLSQYDVRPANNLLLKRVNLHELWLVGVAHLLPHQIL